MSALTVLRTFASIGEIKNNSQGKIKYFLAGFQNEQQFVEGLTQTLTEIGYFYGILTALKLF